MTKKPWTKADLRTLHERFPHEPTSAIAADLGRTYSSVTQKANAIPIEKSAAYLGSLTSRCGDGRGKKSQFTAGLVPWNKGKKGWSPAGAEKTRFTPGNSPMRTWRPIGTESVDAEGYTRRKVSDTGHRQTDWVQVHVAAWEQAHGRKVPDGHVIVFRDHNKTNCAPGNLECITRTELMRRNSYLTQYPPEVAQLMQLKGCLTRAINRRARAAQAEETT